MIKVILWDVDATLLNFLKAEEYAIRKCFEVHGLGVCTDEMLHRYSLINRKYWEMLERGEMGKEEILVGRFQEFFETEGIQTDCAASFNKEYQIRLGDTVVFHDDGYELVKELKGIYPQYAVTNGTKVAQERKLKNSGLDQLFDDVFISDVIGVEKPNKEFFDYVFEKIGPYEKDEILIIGDSLTSDMQGGNNAGIKCCWYNPKQAKNLKGVRIDYEISHLSQVRDILKQTL